MLGNIHNLTMIAFSIYMVQIGLSSSQVVILTSISLLGAIFQPIVGYVVDKTKKPLFVLKIALFTMIIVSFCYTVTTNFSILIILTLINSICRLSLLGIFDSYNMSDTLVNGGNFGKLRSGASLGFGIGLFSILPFTTDQDISNYFYYVMVVAFLVIIIVGTLKEGYALTETELSESSKKTKKLFNSTFILLIIMNFCYLGVMGLKMSYQPILLTSNQMTTFYITCANLITVLPEIFIMPNLEKITCNTKVQKLLLFCFAVTGVQLLFFGFVKNPALLLVIISLHGVTNAFYIPTYSKLLRNSLDKENISKGFLISSTFQALTSMVFNLVIVSVVFNEFGINFIFIPFALMMLLNLILVYNFKILKNL